MLYSCKITALTTHIQYSCIKQHTRCIIAICILFESRGPQAPLHMVACFSKKIQARVSFSPNGKMHTQKQYVDDLVFWFQKAIAVFFFWMFGTPVPGIYCKSVILVLVFPKHGKLTIAEIARVFQYGTAPSLAPIQPSTGYPMRYQSFPSKNHRILSCCSKLSTFHIKHCDLGF